MTALSDSGATGQCANSRLFQVCPSPTPSGMGHGRWSMTWMTRPCRDGAVSRASGSSKSTVLVVYPCGAPGYVARARTLTVITAMSTRSRP